mgnify:CR=1 FL=1
MLSAHPELFRQSYPTATPGDPIQGLGLLDDRLSQTILSTVIERIRSICKCLWAQLRTGIVEPRRHLGRR